jgi:hypothetical protein
MKILHLETELVHAGQIDGWKDGRTYTMKLILAFRSFANTSKNVHLDFRMVTIYYIIDCLLLAGNNDALYAARRQASRL